MSLQLSDILAAIPSHNQNLLTSVIGDGQEIAVIAGTITEWEAIAPFFNLDEAEIEGIRRDNLTTAAQRYVIINGGPINIVHVARIAKPSRWELL